MKNIVIDKDLYDKICNLKTGEAIYISSAETLLKEIHAVKGGWIYVFSIQKDNYRYGAVACQFVSNNA